MSHHRTAIAACAVIAALAAVTAPAASADPPSLTSLAPCTHVATGECVNAAIDDAEAVIVYGGQTFPDVYAVLDEAVLSKTDRLCAAVKESTGVGCPW